MAHGPNPGSDTWSQSNQLGIGRAYVGDGTTVWPVLRPPNQTTTYLYQYRLTDADLDAIADRVVLKLMERGGVVTSVPIRADEV